MDGLTDSQFDKIVDGINGSMASMGESFEEEITYEEAVKRLTQAWLNEEASPKLLTSKYELLEPLVEKIEESEKDFYHRSETEKMGLSVVIRRMEINRLMYIINSYLRSRLKKIEKDPIGVLKEHEERITQLPTPRDALLDPREVTFAEKYFESTKKLMLDEFLHDLVPSLQKIPRVKDPHSNARVFFEVISETAEPITTPLLEDQTQEFVVHLKKGDRMMAPFKNAEEALENGHIRLL